MSPKKTIKKKTQKLLTKSKLNKKKVANKTKAKLTDKKKGGTKKTAHQKPSMKKKTMDADTKSRKSRPKKVQEERKEALRKELIKKREEILKEAKAEISKYIKGETKQLVDTALDDGDWSVIDLSEDISLKQLNTHRENLQKIDEALRKLNEGTYGICEDCGEEISAERLKVLPFAIYCIDCQEKREQLEELERKEGLG